MSAMIQNESYSRVRADTADALDLTPNKNAEEDE